MAFPNNIQDSPEISSNLRSFSNGPQASPAVGHAYHGVHIEDNAHVQLGDTHHHHFHQGWVQNQPGQVPSRQKNFDALLDSLAFAEMGARQQRVAQAMPSTCDWVGDHDGYLAWMDDTLMQEHHGFLWIKGKPGTGKSTVLKYVMEKLELDRPADLLLSYFFNARATMDLEKSILGMYRAIVHQLLRSSSHYLQRIFTVLFERKISGQTDNRVAIVSEWSIFELQDFLVRVMKLPLNLRACLVVDALDEGENQQEVRHMVAFLEDLTLHSLVGSNVIRVCLSSRHYPHITIKSGVSMILEQQSGHRDDISKYISSKLAVQEHFIATNIRSTIQQKSSQIFLWVVLVVGILNDMYDAGAAPEELLDHLETLPDELHGLFKSILLRDKASIKSTVLLFQCVLFALRPLTYLELYHAVKLGTGDTKASQHDISSGSIKRFLIQCSRGLVEVVAEDGMEWTRTFEENEIGYRRSNVTETIYCVVQFIHESVRDFLLKREELVQLCSDLTGNIEGLSHDAIKKCCVAQLDRLPLTWQNGLLDLPRPSNGPALDIKSHAAYLWQSFPLLHYATMFVFNHAFAAHTNHVKQRDFLTSCAANSEHILTKWVLVCDIQHTPLLPFKVLVDLVIDDRSNRSHGPRVNFHECIQRAHSYRLVL